MVRGIDTIVITMVPIHTHLPLPPPCIIERLVVGVITSGKNRFVPRLVGKTSNASTVAFRECPSHLLDLRTAITLDSRVERQPT
jgi:hypothetical protein